jgi:hypothetical protein
MGLAAAGSISAPLSHLCHSFSAVGVKAVKMARLNLRRPGLSSCSAPSTRSPARNFFAWMRKMPIT